MMFAVGHREVVLAKSSMLLILQRQNFKDHKRMSWWMEL